MAFNDDPDNRPVMWYQYVKLPDLDQAQYDALVELEKDPPKAEIIKDRAWVEVPIFEIKRRSMKDLRYRVELRVLAHQRHSLGGSTPVPLEYLEMIYAKLGLYPERRPRPGDIIIDIICQMETLGVKSLGKDIHVQRHWFDQLHTLLYVLEAIAKYEDLRSLGQWRRLRALPEILEKNRVVLPDDLTERIESLLTKIKFGN